MARWRGWALLQRLHCFRAWWRRERGAGWLCRVARPAPSWSILAGLPQPGWLGLLEWRLRDSSRCPPVRGTRPTGGFVGRAGSASASGLSSGTWALPLSLRVSREPQVLCSPEAPSWSVLQEPRAHWHLPPPGVVACLLNFPNPRTGRTGPLCPAVSFLPGLEDPWTGRHVYFPPQVLGTHHKSITRNHPASGSSHSTPGSTSLDCVTRLPSRPEPALVTASGLGGGKMGRQADAPMPRSQATHLGLGEIGCF